MTSPSLAHDEAAHSPGSVLTLAQIGMIAFLASEVSFFSTLIVAYLTFAGKDTVGPTPREALSLPLAVVSTCFLLSSSLTVWLAERQLHRRGPAAFALWWVLTIVLGAVFLGATAYEWRDLIVGRQLTLSRNLFGTTYFTLVGFHALHVTCGLIAMLIVLPLSFAGRVKTGPGGGVELIGWYWHFVDVVWVAVFSVVYLWSRSA